MVRKEWPGTPMAVRRGRDHRVIPIQGLGQKMGVMFPGATVSTLVSAGTGWSQNRLDGRRPRLLAASSMA